MAEPRDCYTFADLQRWSEATADLDRPARLAVIGDPVVHSRSPQMHNPALETAGEDALYVRLHLRPEEIGEAMKLLPEAGFLGINVTIPHKRAVFEAVDELTDVARRAGAVNTVVVEDGQLVGHNTDAPGLRKAIREEFSVDLTDLRIMVIGAGGGAGQAAAAQCALDHCERLVLVNRSVEKAERLREDLLELMTDPDKLEGPASRLVAIPHEERAMEHELSQVDLIVNCTPLGMKRTDPEVLPQRLIAPHHLVFDMVYAPPRTRLMAAAEAEGARAANGLGLLLWQGALSFEFWFNREAPVEAMRKGLMDAM